MKRFAFKLFVFVLGGAVINVAVAWTLAANAEADDWSFYTPYSTGAVLAESRFGWPAPSLINDRAPQAATPRRNVINVNGRNLPALPHWPGFAINTVFYAAIVWAMFAVPGYIKRRRRGDPLSLKFFASKLVIVLLLFSGGAIINVALAGGLIAYAHRFVPGDFGTLAIDPTGFPRPTDWHDRLPTPVNGTYSVHVTGRFGFQLINAWVNDADYITVGASHWERVGWPLFTMKRLAPVTELLRRERTAASAGQWPTWSDLAANQAELPGFAINSIFYAAFLWMIFVMWFAIQRRRRLKRGECVRCAYPVGVSDTCTECGTAVKPQRGAGM